LNAIAPSRSRPPPILSPFDRARRKAYWRLLPLLGVCYVVAYVDRANVGLAKLTMSQALPGFDNAVIGLGAGLFFVGYFLLEIPGCLVVEKWSARKWICRIMITWGVVASLTAFVKTPGQFYLVRFALGLAEAIFSGRHSVSDPLVSEPRPGPNAGLVHRRHAPGPDRQPQNLKLAA
jgi:MFS family permease